MVRSGRFFRALSMFVLKPEDMIQLTRQHYASKSVIEGYSDEALLNGGLGREELELFELIPVKRGRLLILGIGGGRDIIGLGHTGHELYGADYVPEMVSKALNHCSGRGIAFHGVAQDISRIAFRAHAFDIIFFSPALYSCIPTKKRRQAMLGRMHEIIRPGGYLLCQFYWKSKHEFRVATEVVKKMTAWITLGYTEYETGDMMNGNTEFLHAFHDKNALLSELRESGFKPIRFLIFQNGFFGGALLQKPANGGMADHD